MQFMVLLFLINAVFFYKEKKVKSLTKGNKGAILFYRC